MTGRKALLAIVSLALAATGLSIGSAQAAPASAPACIQADVPDQALAVRSATSSNGGAYVVGTLCRNHSNGGWYWTVTVVDTKADGVCAHAVAEWSHKNGHLYSDYGMWVCGNGARQTFHTSTRNPTLYWTTSLGAFADGGPTNFDVPVRTS